jgi:hypothetical protein
MECIAINNMNLRNRYKPEDNFFGKDTDSGR